jgi:hypothetical protein
MRRRSVSVGNTTDSQPERFILDADSGENCALKFLFQFRIKIASVLSEIGIAPARTGAKTVGFVRSRRALLQP